MLIGLLVYFLTNLFGHALCVFVWQGQGSAPSVVNLRTSSARSVTHTSEMDWTKLLSAATVSGRLVTRKFSLKIRTFV